MAANPKGPAYKYVAEQICEHIRKRGLNVGDALPSARELEELLNATPGVMRMALRYLDNDGVITTSQGKPAVVGRLPDENRSAEYLELRQLYDALREQVEGLSRILDMVTDNVGALARRCRELPQPGPEDR